MIGALDPHRSGNTLMNSAKFLAHQKVNNMFPVLSNKLLISSIWQFKLILSAMFW